MKEETRKEKILSSLRKLYKIDSDNKNFIRYCGLKFKRTSLLTRTEIDFLKTRFKSFGIRCYKIPSILLTIEIVPYKSCNKFKNLISKIDYSEIEERNCNTTDCQICGSYKENLLAYPLWSFNPDTKVQKLIGLNAICSKCKSVKDLQVKDFKLIERILQEDKPIKHLKYVNSWKKKEAIEYLELVKDEFYYRKSFNWILDISLLENI